MGRFCILLRVVFLRFIILELFLQLFIPCIQKSRKLFDCIEHILCAQYHGKRYFLHFHKLMQTTNRVTQQKFHRNNRTSGPKHIFSLLKVVITKSYVECFNFMSFPANKLLGMKPLWVTSHCAFSCRVHVSWCNRAAQWTWPCTQPWFNGHGLIHLQLSLVPKPWFL